MIEFLDALSSHFKAHKLKYLLGSLLAMTAIAGTFYVRYNRELQANSNYAKDAIRRLSADC